MKKIFLFLLAASAFTVVSCNNENDGTNTTQSDTKDKKDDVVNEADLPAAVASNFKTKYPDATSVEWEKAKENDQPTFKAKWKTGDEKMKAEFAQDGTFIKEERD